MIAPLVIRTSIAPPEASPTAVAASYENNMLVPKLESYRIPDLYRLQIHQVEFERTYVLVRCILGKLEELRGVAQVTY